MEIGWIKHSGKEVLLIDYTGIKMEKEMIAAVQKVPDLLTNIPEGSKVLMLIDLTGCYATPGFLDESKKLEKSIVDRFSVKRAIIGISGAKEILLKGYNLFAKQKIAPFSTKEEALKFLVKD